MPHNLCQRADGCLEKIRHFEQRGIALISCSHGRYDRHPGFLRAFYDSKLSGNGINRIYDIVIFLEIEQFLRLWQKEYFIRSDCAVRVNLMDSFFRHIHFVSADGFSCGKDLAVEVGKTDLVMIDQIQGSDPASCQSFNGITANASDSENRDTGRGKPFHPLRAVDQLCS